MQRELRVTVELFLIETLVVDLRNIRCGLEGTLPALAVLARARGPDPASADSAAGGGAAKGDASDGGTAGGCTAGGVSGGRGLPSRLAADIARLCQEIAGIESRARRIGQLMIVDRVAQPPQGRPAWDEDAGSSDLPENLFAMPQHRQHGQHPHGPPHGPAQAAAQAAAPAPR